VRVRVRDPQDPNFKIQKQISYDTFKKENEIYITNKHKVTEDFETYLGIIELLLHRDILIRINHCKNIITDNNDDNLFNTATKIKSIMKYLYNNYGPNDSNDVAAIKNDLVNATADNGYHKLLTIHDECINQLNSIKKIDPITKEPILINNQPIFHSIDDADLKAILINQIKDTDHSMFQLKVMAQMNPNITYNDMKTSINNLLKNAKNFNLIGIENETDYTITTTNNNSITANSAKYYSNNKKNNIVCKNCKSTKHYVRQCPSLECTTCKKSFDSPKMRAQHYRLDHMKRKKLDEEQQDNSKNKKYNDNNNHNKNIQVYSTKNNSIISNNDDNYESDDNNDN
jgi:hypothetical protein